MEKKINQYLVDCVPLKKAPKNDYDIAINRVQMIVNAPTAKEAKRLATHIMENHGLYVKPICCEKGRPLIKLTASLRSNKSHFVETVKLGNKSVSLEDCKDFVSHLKTSLDNSLEHWTTLYEKKEEK